MRASEATESIKDLAVAWRDAGLRAPVATPPSSPARCCIADCPGMSFVELKTLAGTRNVCLKHFQSIEHSRPSPAQP